MSPHDSGENDDEHLTISSKDYLKVMLQRYELDNSDIGFVKKQMSLDLIVSIYNTNTTKNPIKFNKMEKLFEKRLVAILKNLMAFNPEKRPTMLEVIRHPYLRDFYNKKDIIEADNRIRIEVDDNKKLNPKDYKGII